MLVRLLNSTYGSKEQKDRTENCVRFETAATEEARPSTPEAWRATHV